MYAPISLLKDMEKGIYIYGAGGYGRNMKNTLSESGYKILGFIDTFKSGYLDDLPIHTFDNYLKNRSEDDRIYVASSNDKEIERNLIANGVTNYRLDEYRMFGVDHAAARFHARGELDRAERLYEEALKRYDDDSQRNVPPDSWTVARLLHGLIGIHFERGNEKDAEKLVDQANNIDTRIVSLSLIAYERLLAKSGTKRADELVQLVNRRRDDFRIHQLRRDTDQSRLSGHIDYPATVLVETLAKCNAQCIFCPYTEITRQGAQMSEALMTKLINELATFPTNIPLRIVPYGVNEPFLDNRIYDFIGRLAQSVPHARVTIASNGSALVEKTVDRLRHLKNVDSLNISLNDYRKDNYEHLMKLPFDRTIKNIRHLYTRWRLGEFPFWLTFSRAGDNTVEDYYFAEWIHTYFPGVSPGISPMADWLGQVDIAVGRVPETGCSHWFEMVIRATGDVAFCCADGKTDHPIGNVEGQTMLEVYNQQRLRRIRETMRDRQGFAPCDRCTKVE